MNGGTGRPGNPDPERDFDIDPTRPGALAPADPAAIAARDGAEAMAVANARRARQRIDSEEALEAAAAAPGVAPPAPEAPFAPKRGSERWEVKTLNDADIAAINLAPTLTTVREMWKVARPGNMPLTYPVPAYQRNRAAGPETTVWQIEGTIIAYKWEKDGDFHIVLQDKAHGETMIVEAPETGSGSDGLPFMGGGCPAPLRARIEAARATLATKLHPSPGLKPASIPARITGVGFFDVLHGQTGVATTNAIELHPILDVEFV